MFPLPFFLALFAAASCVFCAPQPSIIVIGAGPSGVAAASRLLANNFTNLTVLEAEPRIGGRIYSVKFGDAYVDLGAHWCHGEGDNIVYSLVKDLDLVRHTEGEAVIYHSKERISGDFNERLSGLIGAVFGGNTTGVKDSVRNYYLRRFREVYSANLTDPLEQKIANQSSRLLLQFILAHRGSLTLDDIILNRDYRICSGDLRLNWNGAGYRTILDVLIRKIPDPSQQLPFYEKLQLNREVSNVNWGGEGRVRVTTSDGGVFEADHVIFTPSVGVLKHDYETLFTPSLPEEKRTAIQDIGLGAIVDYSFYFPRRWWPNDVFSGYYFVWDEADFGPVVEEFRNFTGNQSTSPEWILDLFNVEPTQNNPNVLTFWVTGSSAPYVELISDEELINGTLFVLNRFLGRYYNIPSPTELIRSRWYSNPHFRGTYSYQTQRAYDRRPSAEVVLSLPLENATGRPVLQFAGEATHPYYYSTVHGAIESGFREADRLIKYYRL